jgi:lipopolysaccharide biosynthesis regulator YciM
MIELLWLLLPVAAASSWWAARREYAEQDGRRSNAEYLKGISYLFKDNPGDGCDREIEVFLRMVEVNQDTAETHLALGNLFRRRGEVDRAVRIHRNLIARNSLKPQQRFRAMLELGEDYMRSGLFDRAEALFAELVKQPDHTATALARLVDIYEQEKDWRQAITHCDRLEHLTGKSKKMETAHYCCELAEEALQEDDPARARELLRQALDRDPNCVRSSILRGRLNMKEARYAAAIAAFQAVAHQNRGFFSEIIGVLGQSYAALERQDEWFDYLREIHENDHSGRVTKALAEVLEQQQGVQAALRFLEDELRQYPTVLGLRQLMELKLNHASGEGDADMKTLYEISRGIFDVAACYKCDNCGFVGKFLHWHCPSCKNWTSVKPIPDLVLKNTL